jgi:hypothetical protein
MGDKCQYTGHLVAYCVLSPGSATGKSGSGMTGIELNTASAEVASA